jgi:hypothetical protein
MRARPAPKRVRAGHVAWVQERLSERDWKILEIVNRLRLVTGWQLERLFFVDLTPRSRIVTRSLSLSRLTTWRVLYRLPRRIGGAMRGSSVAVYALGPAGQRLLMQRANENGTAARVRTSVPSERFVQHILAVSELYVRLVEAERDGVFVLRQFITEPSCWWPNRRGNWLKPDAFFVLSNGKVDHLWWLECDKATESLPTIARKLGTYLDFVRRGQVGPRGAVPRVLVTVPSEARAAAIAGIVRRLPSPADELFTAAVERDALLALLSYLKE